MLRHTTARPCDSCGNFIPPNSDPEPQPQPSLFPFADEPSFRFAVSTFKKIQTSAGEVNDLLECWSDYNGLYDGPPPPFKNVDDLYTSIDAIQHGDAPWESFSVRFNGEVTNESPSWKRQEYRIYCRNVCTVAHNMLSNTEFEKQFDYVPYEEYDTQGERVYSNLMSGKWAYKKAVRAYDFH